MPAWLSVAFGGAIGAIARYSIGNWTRARYGEGFPIGTLFVNVTGSFMLGVVVGLAMAGRLSPQGKLLLGTGFMGAFTTFSTFSVDSVRLLEEGRPGAALGYVGANVVVGAVAAWAGYALVRQVAGTHGS